ncbi:MAG: alpha/beta hydrolase [Bacteroidetes bacterium]|nr:alpha/beta hydrolase [Bacteroidota bacterium]
MDNFKAGKPAVITLGTNLLLVPGGKLNTPLGVEQNIKSKRMIRITRIISILLLITLSPTRGGCQTAKSKGSEMRPGTSSEIRLDTVTLFDQKRKREIPIAIFRSKHKASGKQALVIFSHGYGENKPGAYLMYRYLTDFLALKGYFVVSIQHELPTDSLIPSQGVPQIVRRPFWDRGADNILFVIEWLKKSHPELDFNNIALVGHSNGADMTALFPQKYPGIVRKIITLDNRRMALPRTSNPKVYSLRSSDQPADSGVLPTVEEQQRFGMTIIKLPATKHNDMIDFGTEAQHKEINDYVLRFLR